MFPAGSLFTKGTAIHNGHDGKRFLKSAGCEDQHSKIIHIHVYKNSMKSWHQHVIKIKLSKCQTSQYTKCLFADCQDNFPCISINQVFPF